MKARLCGIFLCVLAFVLSMVLMLNLIESPLKQTPQIGTGSSMSQEDSTSADETDTSSFATDVTSVEGVKSVAKETLSFFNRIAYEQDKSIGNTPHDLILKWKNAALFLQNEQGDTLGSLYYNTLAKVMQEILETPFADANTFCARVPALLQKIAAAAPQTTTPEVAALFPTLDTSANGTLSLALLSMYRLSSVKTGNIAVSFGGTVAMGDYYGNSTYENTYGTGTNNPLRGISPVFGTDDISIVALDNALTTATSPAVPVANAFRGKAADVYAKYLAEAGVDVVSLASCHVNDFGETGYNDTKTALENAGITVAEDGKIAYFEADAGKVAVISFNLMGAQTFAASPVSLIAEARANEAVLVIVYFHTANTSEPETNPDVTTGMANVLRDAAANGADLVLSSHAYVYQGILLRGDDPKTALVFSPGNLSFAMGASGVSTDAYLFCQTFTVAGNKATPATRMLYFLNNNSVGEGATYAPALYLDAASVSRLSAAVYAALPSFEGHIAEGELTFISLA